MLSEIVANDAAVPIRLQDSAETPIAPSQWLPFLAQHRFFVCCPGAAQPMCHNLIEAMSVGTIPLIEYGDRLRPQLTDGENAICFRGADGLRDAIDRIHQLSASRLDEMSQSAAAYYDNHLCGKTFLAAFRDGTLDLTKRQIVMPFHSENFFSQTSPQAA
ncbi:ATPase [Rhodopirellula maiorica SM1]|uniref:ATPase n=1 Tax=Rhodopirellula maiorica SM1 TaxID=1265738 RepID=M5RTS2_9BACT|nr:ATPase [Rhodopirellula maiorica]EMI17354.1 ATPase [Rhodopirellula maiorica SM1]